MIVTDLLTRYVPLSVARRYMTTTTSDASDGTARVIDSSMLASLATFPHAHPPSSTHDR